LIQRCKADSLVLGTMLQCCPFNFKVFWWDQDVVGSSDSSSSKKDSGEFASANGKTL